MIELQTRAPTVHTLDRIDIVSINIPNAFRGTKSQPRGERVEANNERLTLFKLLFFGWRGRRYIAFGVIKVAPYGAH